MPVFNNLVMFDQHTKQSRLDAIVPDLATSWTWNEDGTAVTFRLRHGVKWHDGRSFTANDVKCTWDLILDAGPEKLRINARKSWYKNLEQVTSNGDDEVTFQLKRPQPALFDANCQRLVANLPVPRAGGADAPASDWHRPFQVRRVQAE
jgi:peptide/nickel transport system substrate-binding protein